MKARIVCIIVVILLLLSFPTTFLVGGFLLPAQYDDSYYGELGEMYDKLTETKGKKIVVIGTSSVAFGVNSALMEKELKACGLDYTVCNFGLYGVLGTKLMLDLSRDKIKEGDVVIFAPENLNQELSLYFSAEHTWMAMDGRYNMLGKVGGDNKSALVGNFPHFAADKMGYFASGKKPSASGVYNKSSFNANCDMVYERASNEMLGGYDSNALVTLSGDIFDKDFIDYVNAYAREIKGRGAEIYYAFSPVNVLSLSAGTTDESIRAFYEFIEESFVFPIIGNPLDHILDCEWFYDSNVHLNSSGMTVHTRLLADEIKSVFDISAPSSIEMPIKPDLPAVPETKTGNNDDEELFIYEETASGFTIAGVTELIAGKTSVVIPYSHLGKTVTSFDSSVFKNNEDVKSVTIQSNIKRLADNCFEGCSSLKSIILEQREPSAIGVGWHLLDGTEDCFIYLPDGDVLNSYALNYFWGHYAGSLKTLK